jgi:hypothetical protein
VLLVDQVALQLCKNIKKGSEKSPKPRFQASSQMGSLRVYLASGGAPS